MDAERQALVRELQSLRGYFRTTPETTLQGQPIAGDYRMLFDRTFAALGEALDALGAVPAPAQGQAALVRDTKDLLVAYNQSLPSRKAAEGTVAAIAIGLLEKWIASPPQALVRDPMGPPEKGCTGRGGLHNWVPGIDDPSIGRCWTCGGFWPAQGSCLVCGQFRRFVAWHAETPTTGVCEPCRTKALASQAPQALVREDVARQIRKLVLKQHALREEMFSFDSTVGQNVISAEELGEWEAETDRLILAALARLSKS